MKDQQYLKRYLTVEAPDTAATVDFLFKHGVTVTLGMDEQNGKPVIHITAFAHDDQTTILGEILAVIPEGNEWSSKDKERARFLATELGFQAMPTIAEVEDLDAEGDMNVFDAKRELADLLEAIAKRSDRD